MKKGFISIITAMGLVLSCEKAPEEVAVTSVSIGQASAELLIGETVQLSASIQPSNATDKSVAWATSNQSVATVSNSGLVTAIAEGTSTITASAGGKSATCTVKVSKGTVEVSSITLDKEFMELVEGDTTTLTAIVKPDDATDKTVTWSSSDATVASVDNGKITALKEGITTVTAKAGDKIVECKVTVAKKYVAVESIELNKTAIELRVSESETLIATVKPEEATDKTMTWSSSDEGVATVNSGVVSAISIGEAIITVMTIDGGKTATCVVTVKYAIPEAIDLGLSVKWASFNIGSLTPEGYGDYYAWGETDNSQKTWGVYGSSNYIWCNDGNIEKLTKYCPTNMVEYWDGTGAPDGKTVLDMEDDIAHVELGGKWRMPTKEEWTELIDNCTLSRTTQSTIKGILVTSNINGNSIFIPAAGYRSGTLWGAGQRGCYWSSSLNKDYPSQAYYMIYESDYEQIGSLYRSFGHSIRPVSD